MPEPYPISAGPLTPAAFAARFRESSRVLWCVAAGIVGNRSQAEDILQEAAMRALTKLGTFDPESSFVAWMSQFVRYIALNDRRKHDRREQVLRQGIAPQSERGTQAPLRLDPFDAHVTRALQTLGETARTCLLLKTVLEMDYAEIAEQLDIPAGTAMSHVSRARSKMRGLLEEPAPVLQPRGAS